jgi:hypothetical protein
LPNSPLQSANPTPNPSIISQHSSRKTHPFICASQLECIEPHFRRRTLGTRLLDLCLCMQILDGDSLDRRALQTQRRRESRRPRARRCRFLRIVCRYCITEAASKFVAAGRSAEKISAVATEDKSVDGRHFFRL